VSDRRIKLLIDVPVEPSALEKLRASGRFEIDVIDPPAESARPIDPQRLQNISALFCTFPPSNIADARALRWIQIASTGYTQLFGLDLPSRSIRATNARGCFDVPIGEWAVAMMVNLARDLRQMIRNQQSAMWDRSAIFQRELRGMTVGLWGYGGIGRETARQAKHMGLRVHVLTRSGKIPPRRDVYTVPGTGDPDGVLPDQVHPANHMLEFLATLDFLVLALPLTKATEGLIGERELKALPRTAFLLNPARGPIVRQDALIRALEEGWIAGAALDAHYQYPTPPDSPLWHFPNVIFTPHIAGSSLSPRFRQRLWDIFAVNVERFAQGEPLFNELTPAQLAGN
jgi:phosphoglycerate dehydrogenase-like enzyme